MIPSLMARGAGGGRAPAQAAEPSAGLGLANEALQEQAVTTFTMPVVADASEGHPCHY